MATGQIKTNKTTYIIDGDTFEPIDEGARSEIASLKEDFDEMYNKRVVNSYVDSTVSTFSTIGNTYTYFITDPIRTGERLSNIEVDSPSSGTLTLYLCRMDFDTNKVSLIDYRTVACTQGKHSYSFTEYKADEDTYIGLNGSGVLRYKNDKLNTGNYGTQSNPVYEASTAINSSGETSLTVNSDARFCYAVNINVFSTPFVTSGDIANLEEEINSAIPSATLDRINALKYVSGTGEYTLWGRWFDMSVNSVVRKVTNNAGSEIMFRITGASSVVFTFDQRTPNTVNPFIAVSVDGGAFTRYQLNNNSVTVALPDDGEHICRCSVDAISQTDGAYKWNGTGAFALVSIVPNAGTMTAIKPVNKIGMFYGDSITEGINVLGNTGDNTSQSATQSYSYWVARLLNSVRCCIGYGGTGIYNNGSFHPAIYQIDYLKDGVLAGEIYPDYIVTNWGYNDYSGYDSASFVSGYKEVLDRLRVKYSGVPIFLVHPFVSQSSDKYVNGLKTLVESYDNVYFIDAHGWNGETTDNTHLSVNGAKSNGTAIAHIIERVLGKSFFV